MPENPETDKPAENSAGPRGAMALFIAPDGYVVASAGCFEKSSAGGVSDENWQERMAKKAVYTRALEALCHPDVPKSLKNYDAERLCRAMVEKCEYRIEIIWVGLP